MGYYIDMAKVKNILKRCTLLCMAALMAMPLFGCGKKEKAEAVEAAVVIEPPEEQEERGNQLVEITVTPHIAPVVTPVPTPKLPEVVECEPKKGYTKKSGVNMREHPTTDAEVLDTLDRAVALTISGTAGEWTRVTVNGETGYISSEFLGEGSVPSVLTIDNIKRQNGIATASVNMRKSPDTGSDIIDELDLFTHFTVTGQNDDWYEIEYQDERGYVSKKYSELAVGYYDADDLYLVAQLVHQEAKYTTLEGMVAVANVVYNRLRSSRFPNTIEGVVFEEGQFSPAESGRNLRSVRASSSAIEAVLEVFGRGKTILPRNVLYFRASRMGTSWTSARKYYATYGGNCFFK